MILWEDAPRAGLALTRKKRAPKWEESLPAEERTGEEERERESRGEREGRWEKGHGKDRATRDGSRVRAWVNL